MLNPKSRVYTFIDLTVIQNCDHKLTFVYTDYVYCYIYHLEIVYYSREIKRKRYDVLSLQLLPLA